MREAENIRQLAGIEPDYIGFIFYPKSKRYVESVDTSSLSFLPPSVKKAGVFVDASLAEITTRIDRFKLDAVQLHGQESPALCKDLRGLGMEVIKGFGIDNNFNFNTLNSYSGVADYFLFDTKTDQHGGSGKLFDWNLLKQYRLETPYFLSGGLSADNLNEILNIDDSRLYALDLNSRFELEPGLKDIHKLKLFFNRIRIPA